jgi:hypothetical protein
MRRRMSKFNFEQAWIGQAILPLEEARETINFLIESEGPYQSGTSFAVTTEYGQGEVRTVYLSQSSYDRLKVKFPERWSARG